MTRNNKVFINLALNEQRIYVSLWSLGMFDPQMGMLDMMFRYVREKELVPTTFAGLLPPPQEPTQ